MLRERFRTKLSGEQEGQIRAWKFALVPMMMLHRLYDSGSVDRAELLHRADRFAAGRWSELLQEAMQVKPVKTSHCERSEEAEHEHRGRAVQARVQRGQVSRARHGQVGPDTLSEFRDKRPQHQLMQIPGDVLNFAPASPVQLDHKIFAMCLRGAPSGSSVGPGGCSFEMLKVLLDGKEGLLLLIAAAEDFARVEGAPIHFQDVLVGLDDGIAKTRRR